jgi:rubrerythrin
MEAILFVCTKCGHSINVICPANEIQPKCPVCKARMESKKSEK